MILVATDFSAAGARSADLAGRLALLRGSSICLLHVFESPAGSLPELALDPALQQELLRRAVSQLTLGASTLRARGILVEERLEVDRAPALVIAEVANQLNPELVVVGRHGRRALPRLLLGSVAESALLRINQPVLVVPDGGVAATSTGPGVGWHLAVALESSSTDQALIDWVRDFRAHSACDVTFIHLYWPVSEYERFGLRGPRDAFEPDSTTIALLQRSLTRIVGALPGAGKTTFRILPSWGSTGERLVEEAAQVQADLLVVGTHHRRGLSRLWHGATAPPALHAATLPVLCISQTDRRPAAPRTVERPRNVLAATDLSELGNRAIVHAYGLVRAERGTVQLLYVHERPLPSPAYVYAAGSEGSLTATEEVDLRARLLAQVPADAAELGITTEISIVDGGRAGDVICQTAERLDADAIVIGSHGRAGLARALLGSVAAQVLHQAHRPVFVARYPWTV